MSKTLTNKQSLQAVDAVDGIWSSLQGLFLIQEYILEYKQKTELGCALASLLMQMQQQLNELDEVLKEDETKETAGTG